MDARPPKGRYARHRLFEDRLDLVDNFRQLVEFEAGGMQSTPQGFARGPNATSIRLPASSL